MKKYGILFAVLALVLASLACQTVLGGGEDEGLPEIPEFNDGGGNNETVPTVPPVSPEGDGLPSLGTTTEFPLPADASNVISMGSDIVNFQTKLSLDEAMKFYLDEFDKKGYTERDGFTVTTDTTFSMVIDGHESGKAITVQGVDLGDGTVNISISLVDI